MSETQRHPEEKQLHEKTIVNFEAGAVIKSTLTGRYLFVTHVSEDKIRGKEINEKGELVDPNPDKWHEVETRIAAKHYVEVSGIDVSNIQQHVVGRIGEVVN